MKKLTKLTDKQIARMHEYAKERIEIQLNTISTEETEKEAENNLRLAYDAAGLDGRKLKIAWVDSPIEFMARIKGDNRASVWASVRDSVRDFAWDSVRDFAWASVWASARDSVRDSVRDFAWDSVRASVWASARDSVRASVGASVRASVRASVGASVWDSVWASVRDSVRTYYYAEYFAFYGFFNEILEQNDLRFLDRFNQLVSGYALFADEAVVVRKPRLLTLDENGRLHNEVQKCMEYRDGWGFYAWHGTRVPEWVITTPANQLTKKQVLEEQNQEVKRVLVEKVGYETFLNWIDAKLLDESGDYKLLHSKEKVDDEELYLLKCKDSSTERIYHLRVPPTVKNCMEAVAWTFNVPTEQYAPEQES